LSLILQELLLEQLRQLQEPPRVHQPLEPPRVHQPLEPPRVHQYDPKEQLL
jgi:hypothetical protein